jgi:hypothetical protein
MVWPLEALSFGIFGSPQVVLVMAEVHEEKMCHFEPALLSQQQCDSANEPQLEVAIGKLGHLYTISHIEFPALSEIGREASL